MKATSRGGSIGGTGRVTSGGLRQGPTRSGGCNSGQPENRDPESDLAQISPERPSWSYTSGSVLYIVRWSMISRHAEASIPLRDGTGRLERC